MFKLHVGDIYRCRKACRRRRQLHRSSVVVQTGEVEACQLRPPCAARCPAVHTTGRRNLPVVRVFSLHFCTKQEQPSCTTSANTSQIQRYSHNNDGERISTISLAVLTMYYCMRETDEQTTAKSAVCIGSCGSLIKRSN